MPERSAVGTRDIILNSANHWRKRAKETRALAEAIADSVAKSLILRTADDYDKLAERAEERAQKKTVLDAGQ